MKFHPDTTNLDKKTASDIFARGSFLYNTSPYQFINYLIAGNYISVEKKLVDSIKNEYSKDDFYIVIYTMSDIFNLMEKSFSLKINPMKFDSLKNLISKIVRIFYFKYISIFKKIRNRDVDVKNKIFMYERLDYTLQMKVVEVWKEIYLKCLRKKRSILNKDSLVQIICRTKGRVPNELISELYRRINEGVSEIIESRS